MLYSIIFILTLVLNQNQLCYPLHHGSITNAFLLKADAIILRKSLSGNALLIFMNKKTFILVNTFACSSLHGNPFSGICFVFKLILF